MGFINFIVELLSDPRTAIAGWIAAGPLQAYGFVFLIWRHPWIRCLGSNTCLFTPIRFRKAVFVKQ